jgi:hypothetical protein
MIFVDGSWLYRGRQVLFDVLGEEDGFEIDYKRIPAIIANGIAQCLEADVDVVRTCYFGTIPVNKAGYNPTKQRSFYDFLALQCAYDTEIVEIDYRREPNARAEDKWANVALAASMVYYASLPGIFDVAALLAGEADYIPLLRRVRQMGKRTQVVAINNLGGKYVTSAMLLTSPGIHDLPPIFLDEHANEVKLVRAEQKRTCKQCGKEESTTWAGPEFFCSECRSQHRRQMRTCDNCGREEETTWDKPYFYCSQCRRDYRDQRPAERPAERPERPEDA